jgi:hypothetical protein
MPKEIEKERKKWSPAWNLFEKISKKRARCKKCGHEEDCSNNTSNLLRHLKTSHPGEYFNSSDPQKPTSIQTTLLRPIPLCPEKSEKISQLIGKWIARNNRPISIIEDKGLQELFAELEPRYTLISRTTLANSIIPEIYGQVNRLLYLFFEVFRSSLM